MKGIILAGGMGTRLHPLTKLTNKHLVAVYDKPMIYYPLSLLMLGGIKEIMIISSGIHTPQFQTLLGDGSHLGLNIEYGVQEKASGIPDAFLIGEKFIGNENVALILGDNLFYGDIDFYRRAIKNQIENKDAGAHVFAYYVSNPSDYGIVEFDKKTKSVLSIEEKPKNPKSNFAIPGLYLFDSSSVAKAKNIKPSARGETEITDVINQYQDKEKLKVEQVTRGVAWLDMGTPLNLLKASTYIQTVEERQGLKIACLEEIAYRMNFISKNELKGLISEYPNSDYKNYLLKIEKEL